MAMKQATHISSCLQHFAVNNICNENGNSQLPHSNDPPTEEENFDISEVLQSIGDAMEGLCTIYKVPLVIYFADSEWRSINIVSKPAVLRHSIIEVRIIVPFVMRWWFLLIFLNHRYSRRHWTLLNRVAQLKWL
jgi:hypothetical protein